MLSPELIESLLRESLPVRLALLDAEPTGAGWMAYPEPDGIEPSADLYQRRQDDSSRRIVDGGAAFLPCNPLAIVEHAARLKFGIHATGLRATIEREPSSIGLPYSASAAIDGDDRYFGFAGVCPHTAAVALLREVVGG